MPNSASAPQIHSLRHGPFSLGICPEVGGCITCFNVEKGGQTYPLFRPYDPRLPADPLNFASFPLTPFSNRIGYGKLAFDGKTYSVGPAFGGEPHPNHGSGWQTPWQLAELSGNRAVMTLKVPASAESPYDYEAAQILELTDKGLTISMTVRNTGSIALPFGTGHHPYFVRTPQTRLTANLPKVWLSKDMVPTELVDVPANWDFSNGLDFDPAHLEAKHGGDGTAYIDHCFAGWNQMTVLTWPEYNNLSLEISADPIFQHFVIFVPSKGDFLCAEPVTNATDGFNLMSKGIANTGSVVLAPQEDLTGSMFFHLGA